MNAGVEQKLRPKIGGYYTVGGDMTLIHGGDKTDGKVPDTVKSQMTKIKFDSTALIAGQINSSSKFSTTQTFGNLNLVFALRPCSGW